MVASPAHRLRVLHISDLHERASREREPYFREPVLGERWDDNLREISESGPIDLLLFTGDVAFSGSEDEYERATGFVHGTREVLGLGLERVFVIPGNHDVARLVQQGVWQKLRERVWRADPLELSRWMAGLTREPPLGFEPEWREQLLEREQAFWNWLDKGLGRPELLPSRSPHGLLGYRCSLRPAGMPCDVHVLGFDTAWLAGDNHDASQLRLTRHQVERLGTRDGLPLEGLRLGLMHHPLHELADGDECFPLLSQYLDVLLRGHLHKAQARTFVEPDRQLIELPAGSLFDSHAGAMYRNGCQVLTLELDAHGSLQAVSLQYRSWSPQGRFWHDDPSIYRTPRLERLAPPSASLRKEKITTPRPAEAVTALDRLTTGLGHLATNMEQFLNEYLGSADNPRAFGGRAPQLAALHEWLAAPEQRHALMVAPAGRGKSALVAHWICEVLQAGSTEVVFVPVSVRFSTAMLGNTLRLLGERLRYLDRATTAHPTRAEEWQAEIRQALRKDRETPLLVVLDGADEAVDWLPGKELMFPQPLGRNVKLLVAARPVGARNLEGWRRQLGLGAGALALELPPLTEEEVRDALRSLGARELAADPRLVRELYRLSEGDPLVVRLYLDALSGANGRPAFIQEKDLQHLQPGLGELFETWFQFEDERWRLAGTEALHSAMEELLGICAAALGPLHLEDISRVAEGSLRQIPTLRRALASAGRFVIGDGERQGLVFSHPRLRDFWFESMLAPHDRERWEQRFLELGRETLRALPLPPPGRRTPSEYAVRFHGAHLQRARAAPEFFYELLHVPWMKAWERLDETFGGFLLDVDKAWEAAERAVASDPAHTAWLVKCGIFHSTVVSLNDLPPLVLVQLVKRGIWSLERALALSRRLPDTGRRIRALTLLAPLSPEPAQHALYEEALAQFSSLDANEAMSKLGEIASPLPPDLLHSALRLLDGVEPELMRLDTLIQLLDRAPALPPEALSAVEALVAKCPEDVGKALLLCAIQRKNAHADPDLLRYALLVTVNGSESVQCRALSEIAQLTQDEHMKQEAYEKLLRLAPESPRVAIKTLVTAGSNELRGRALKMARALQSADKRGFALLEFVEHTSRTEERAALLKEVLQCIPRIEMGSTRLFILAKLLRLMPPGQRNSTLEQAHAAVFYPYEHNALRVEALVEFALALDPTVRPEEATERERMLEFALKTAREAVSVEETIDSFAIVMDRLPPELHARIRDEAFTLLPRIDEGQALRDIASHFVEHLTDEQLRALPGVLNRIGDLEERVSAVAFAGSRLDALLRARAERLCRDWLQRMTQKRAQVRALLRLSQTVPANEVPTTLKAAFDVLRAIDGFKNEAVVELLRRAHHVHHWDLVFQALDAFFPEQERSMTDVQRSFSLWDLADEADLPALVEFERRARSLMAHHASLVLAKLAARYAELGSLADAQRLIASLSSDHAMALALVAQRLPPNSPEQLDTQREALESLRQTTDDFERAHGLSAALPFLELLDVVESCVLIEKLHLRLALGGLELQAERLVELGFPNAAASLMPLAHDSLAGARLQLVLARATGDWEHFGTHARAALDALCSLNFDSNVEYLLNKETPHLRTLRPTVLAKMMFRLIHAAATRGRPNLLRMLAPLMPLLEALGGQPLLARVVDSIEEICRGKE